MTTAPAKPAATKPTGPKLIMRAFALPIKFPDDQKQRVDLLEKLDRAFAYGVRVANLAQTEIWRATSEHFHDREAFEAKPGPRYGDSYNRAVKSEAGDRLYADVAGAINKRVSDQWAATIPKPRMKRWLAVCFGLVAIPSFRTIALPVRGRAIWLSQSHAPHLGRGGEPFVWFPLYKDDDGKIEWVELPLCIKGDRNSYRRFCRLLEDPKAGKEVALYRRPNGRIMCKFVDAVMPRPGGATEGTLTVVTRADCLWAASKRGRPKDWWYNAPHIRSLITRCDRKAVSDHRLRQDAKAESRRAGRGPLERMKRQTIKHRDRVQNELHKAARFLVNHALRKRVAALLYDDTCRDFSKQFPWADLKQKVQEKAQAAGIEFIAIEQHKQRLERRRNEESLLKIESHLEKMKGDVSRDDNDDSTSEE